MAAIYAVGIYILCISVSGVEAANISQYDASAYCTAYCDVYGYYQPAKWCVSQDPTVDVYCCGSQHNRYCCSDQQKDVGDLYPAVKDCPNSSWWHYQWKVIIGLLGTLVVMLMFAACCYYCCGGDTRLPSRSRFLRRRGAQTNQGSDSSPYGENNLSFNPESPNAFTPPDYDTLPKHPPKYGDIFSAESGETYPGVDPSLVVLDTGAAVPEVDPSIVVLDTGATHPGVDPSLVVLDTGETHPGVAPSIVVLDTGADVPGVDPSIVVLDTGVTHPGVAPSIVVADTEAPQSPTDLPAAPPVYTPTDVSAATVDNPNYSGTNTSTNSTAETGSSDVTTVCRSSDNHSSNNIHDTTDSNLLSQSNTQDQPTGNYCQCTSDYEEISEVTQNGSGTNQTSPDDVSTAMTTGETLSANDVCQVNGEPPK